MRKKKRAREEETREGRGSSVTPRVSPSHAPVLSFAHYFPSSSPEDPGDEVDYFQAPATQANTKKNSGTERTFTARMKKQTASDNTFYYAHLSLDLHWLVRHTAYLPYFSCYSFCWVALIYHSLLNLHNTLSAVKNDTIFLAIVF